MTPDPSGSPGRGGPPQFPPPPSERSEPHTPGGSSGLQSRIYAPSMAFAVTTAARLLLFPPIGGVLTTRQASLDASDRSVAPPDRALDAALRPRGFLPEAGSLLPGLLTATRTGPTPAGDDELMLDQLLNKHLQLLGTRRVGRFSIARSDARETIAYAWAKRASDTSEHGRVDVVRTRRLERSSVASQSCCNFAAALAPLASVYAATTSFSSTSDSAGSWRSR
jgi:hypothetical protein